MNPMMQQGGLAWFPLLRPPKLLQSTPFWLLVLSHIQNAGSLILLATFA